MEKEKSNECVLSFIEEGLNEKNWEEVVGPCLEELLKKNLLRRVEEGRNRWKVLRMCLTADVVKKMRTNFWQR